MTDNAAKSVLLCMEASKSCWGEVKTYSFDMDLPVITLCQGHLWELMNPIPRERK